MRFIKRVEAYSAFKEKDIDDFDGFQIVNFDESEKTNFAVLREETIVADSNEKKNTLVASDEEKGEFVFDNIDSTISALSVGDVLYCVYGTGVNDYLLLKVGEIEIYESAATIKEGRAELSEYFEYIDVDMDIDVPVDNLVALNNSSEVVQTSRVYASALNSGKSEMAKGLLALGGDSSTKFQFGYKGDAVSLTAESKITLAVKIQFDAKILELEELKISIKTNTTVDGRLTGKAKDTYKKETPEILLPTVAGLDGEAKGYFVFEVESSVAGVFKATQSTENGILYSGGSCQRIKESDSDMSLEIKGSFKCKTGIGVEGTVKVLKVLRLTVTGEGGIELTGDTDSDIVKVDTKKDEKHICVICIDGELDAYFKVSVSGKVGVFDKLSWTLFTVTPAEVKIKINDFYVSFGNDDSEIEFGWGSCPHKAYLVTVVVKDQQGTPISNVDIDVIDQETNLTSVSGKTNQTGIFETYCTNGIYILTAFGQTGYEKTSENRKITIEGRAAIVTLTLNRLNEASHDTLSCSITDWRYLNDDTISETNGTAEVHILSMTRLYVTFKPNESIEKLMKDASFCRIAFTDGGEESSDLFQTTLIINPYYIADIEEMDNLGERGYFKTDTGFYLKVYCPYWDRGGSEPQPPVSASQFNLDNARNQITWIVDITDADDINFSRLEENNMYAQIDSPFG